MSDLKSPLNKEIEPSAEDSDQNEDVEQNEDPLLPQPEEPPTLYKEQPWRWVNLTVFVLCSLVNSMPTHTFTPINSIVGRIFDVNKTLIAMNTLIFPISHPIIAFLCNWIIDKYGLRVGCNLGSGLIILGVWARCLIQTSFGFPLLGSLLAAVGNIFIINSPSKIANVWFKPSMVALVTTLGVMSNLASNALGAVFPSFFVNKDSVASDVRKLLLFEAVIVSIPCVACLFLIRKEPSTPPSLAAANTHATENYKKDLKHLFSRRNYVLLMVVCSASYGTLVAFITVIEYLILPFKYPDASKVASDMLLAAIISGFLGSLVFVTVLKKTKQYRKILVVAMIGCTLEIACVAFALDTRTFWAIIIIVAFVGFFFIPQLPIILELGCELAYPIGEASSSGFLLAGGQLLGFLAVPTILWQGTGCLQILDGEQVWRVFLVIGMFVLFLLIGGFTMFFVKEDLRRSKYEQKTSSAILHSNIKES